MFRNSAIAVTLVLSISFLTGCQATDASSAAADAKNSAKVERGRYLVSFGGCHDCHTPLKMTDQGPQPDMSRMLSGHPESLKMTPPPKLAGPWGWTAAITNTAFSGPWGVSYTFNLTPDEHTGIGIWTEEMFVKTFRTGRHMGTSRPINPPMPWQNVASLTDEDLKALYAYLRTIPPVRNHVPDYLEPSEVAKTLK